MSIPHRSVLITGASSGIGAALARHYAQEGVTLFINGRDSARLGQTAEACMQKGAKVFQSLIGVTEGKAMADWIAQCHDQAPLDLVIANAGISGGTGGQAGGEPLSQAQEIFDVNVQGVLSTIHPAIGLMTARRSGQIAVIGSLASLRGFPGAPAYSASKGAVRFYAEALRPSLARQGVRMNVVLPGFVESRMTEKNDFPMPFLMTADRAAQIIASGLAQNKSRIAFPMVLYILAGFAGLLPDWIAQRVLTALPEKRARTF